MKKEDSNIIIKKSNEIEIGVFNNSDKYIVTHKRLGYRMVINIDTLNLLNLIDNKTTIKDIVIKYNNLNTSGILNIETAYLILYGKLSEMGVILKDDILIKKKEIASYLALSFTLINRKRLGFFMKILSPIIVLKHFYKIILISTIIVFIVVTYNNDELIEYAKNMNFNNWVSYLFISGFVLFFHEFGHATACNKLGAEPGTIGFGFYLLSPVMFADVSDIWKLQKRERIIVNLSGIYVEIIIALFLTILYLLTNYTPVLIVSSLIIFRIIINLNPLLRYDGYWILSDLTSTHNLRDTTIKMFKKLTLYVIGRNKFVFNLKNIFLVIYAFISISFIFIFLGFIIINDPNSILSFPIDVFLYSKDIVNREIPFVLFELSKFILPAMFYFIALKFIISYFSNKIKKHLATR